MDQFLEVAAVERLEDLPRVFVQALVVGAAREQIARDAPCFEQSRGLSLAAADLEEQPDLCALEDESLLVLLFAAAEQAVEIAESLAVVAELFVRLVAEVVDLVADFDRTARPEAALGVREQESCLARAAVFEHRLGAGERLGRRRAVPRGIHEDHPQSKEDEQRQDRQRATQHFAVSARSVGRARTSSSCGTGSSD